MPRLIVHLAGESPRAIELRPGVNRVGRLEENDYVIPHHSVSGRHCEIDVGSAGMTVRDLDSTNGTFVDQARVTAANLVAGQWLRIGEVECEVRADDVAASSGNPLRINLPTAPPSPSPSPSEPESEAVWETTDSVDPFLAATASPDDCVNHAGVTGRFHCPACVQKFCRDCTTRRVLGMRDFPACPNCGGICVDAEEGLKGAVGEGATFYQLLPGAFSYPFKKDGLILLICGTVFFGLLELAQNVLGFFNVGIFSLAFMITAIMSFGYLFAFMQNIVVSSVHGDEQMPPFPSVTDFLDGFIAPAFRLFVMTAVLCGPGVLTMIYVHPMVGAAVSLLGLFCFPMAILTVSLADSLGGLNPFVIFSGIAKLPVAYFVTCLVFLAAFAVQGGTRLLLDYIGIPLLPAVIGTFVTLYLVTAEMRILGLLYFTNKEELAWFR